LEDKRDDLIRDYWTVLSESSILIVISGILFGFLLNMAVDSPDRFTLTNTVSLLVAIFSVTVAMLLFALPVIYHHIQYPYTDIEKFKLSHRFLVFGMVPLGVTLYLGLAITLSSMLEDFAFIPAIFPFIIVYALFRMRKQCPVASTSSTAYRRG
jgi:hypothetical protein